MANNNQNQRLNGFTPLSYIGANAIQPTNFTTSPDAPTVDDSVGFNLGDWWLNTTDNSIWYLAATDGLTATWISISGSGPGAFLELTGNDGLPVFPMDSDIDTVGDGVTIDISDNPGTSTLTARLLPAVPLSLTGNTGGAVPPTAGNINIVGSVDITVAGNLATNTLTVSAASVTPTSFLTQSGTATPAAGILNIFGSNGITTSASGSTVTVTAGPSIAQSYITSPATGTAIPAAGVITFAGTGTTTVSAAGSAITISNTAGAPVVTYTEGSFVPFITVNGVNTGTGFYSRQGYYVQIGNVLYISVAVSFGTVIGGNTGPIGIGGFPYASAASYGTANGNFSWVTNPLHISQTSFYLVGKMVINTTYLQLYHWSSATGTSLTTISNGTFQAGNEPYNITLQGFYFI